MPELKNHQQPMTIDEQIVNLKEKNLIVDDEDYARSILSEVCYFRLIKAYSLGLKQKMAITIRMFALKILSIFIYSTPLFDNTYS